MYNMVIYYGLLKYWKTLKEPSCLSLYPFHCKTFKSLQGNITNIDDNLWS